ncbi:DUF6787 family protein [Sediminitomix flava]|uniref:DUF6787 domain-containing protein n=1 Tax=Sediminitomix flava TaxID=379075 RepID=A0A315Z7V7_SEDFL|nr:DUF6787 family protein [Sediminitomix flava]PWJ41042.1 hypothetical protein BC781_104317 [Sediminitomix flava]
MHIWDKLKERWEVKSGWQVLLILITFACTGFSILEVKKWIYGLIGFPTDASVWLKILGFIFIVFPIYQIVLLFYGTIFGQFKFFWNFEKKMVYRMIGRKPPKKED